MNIAFQLTKLHNNYKINKQILKISTKNIKNIFLPHIMVVSNIQIGPSKNSAQPILYLIN